MRRGSLPLFAVAILLLTTFAIPIITTPNQTHAQEMTHTPWQVGGGKNASNITSNLSWGPSSGLNAFVAVGTPLTMSINITNGAAITDSVNFTIEGENEWSCNWYATNQSCSDAMVLVIAPGQLVWPKFTILVPDVVNGSPAAFVRHPFTLTAKSGIDSVEVDYTFTLEPDELFQAAFESESTDMTLDPGMKKRITLEARNTGNSPASLVARIVPVDEQGNPLAGFTPELSYQHDGWLVGLFNFHNLNGAGGGGMGAHTTALFDVEVQPPSVTSGEEKIGVLLWSANNPYETDMIVVNASILWQRDGALHIDDGCDGGDVLPDRSCLVSISISNLGNHQDSFELEVESDDWLNPILSRSFIVLDMGENQPVATLTLTVMGLVPAFSHGGATIILKLDSGEELARQTVELRVAPLVDWELHAIESSTDSRDNVSVAFTLKNLGNGDDGLQVTLHVDMNVDHALIPPDLAQHGSETGQPRYFEYDELPPGVNFTFRAWMHLPRDMEANGTVTMTVDMQSTLRPDVVFSNETSAKYLAEKYRPENQPEENLLLKIEVALAEIWNEFNGLVFTVIVALIGGFGLLKAVQHRKRKDDEWKAKIAAAEGPPPEEPEEWLEKFDKSKSGSSQGITTGILQAPAIAGKVFQDLFKAKSRTRKPAPPAKPDGQLLIAANTVLTHHEKSIEGDLLDNLAGELSLEKQKHPANTLLPAVENETGRTVRRPKRKPATVQSEQIGQSSVNKSPSVEESRARPKRGEKSKLGGESVRVEKKTGRTGRGEKDLIDELDLDF